MSRGVYFVDSIDHDRGLVRVAQEVAGLPCDWQDACKFTFPCGLYCCAPAIPASDAQCVAQGISPFFWPGYHHGASTKPTLPAPAVAPAPAVRCECGSEKAGCGAGAHSDWCPKAGRP